MICVFVRKYKFRRNLFSSCRKFDSVWGVAVDAPVWIGISGENREENWTYVSTNQSYVADESKIFPWCSSQFDAPSVNENCGSLVPPGNHWCPGTPDDATRQIIDYQCELELHAICEIPN